MSASPLDRHLKSILEKRLEQLAGALQGSRRAPGVESVHDLRVASRRLRAFAGTFRDVLGDEPRRRLEKKLKRVTRAVGSLRDLDVQLELLERRLATTSQELERAALEHLLEHLALRRGKAARNAERRLDTLDTHAMSRLVRRALRAVTGGLSDRDHEAYALSVLEGLVSDAAEQVPAPDGAEDPEAYHRLRIDLKQLRYALELFEPVLGSKFPVLYARATTLQEELGNYHDLVTLTEVVGERSAELETRHRDTLVRGLDAVGEALLADRQVVLGRLGPQAFDADGWRDTLRQAVDPR
jgi:CHAD domain-containing protein